MDALLRLLSGNISATIAADLGQRPDEQVDTLVRANGLRVERIVSMGHRSPEGFWYDQPEDEFVLLVSGAARLSIHGAGERTLGPGDWMHIPARVRHRVEWTDPAHPAVWLAVFSSS
jgi:cupin 2 domain-containing protein